MELMDLLHEMWPQGDCAMGQRRIEHEDILHEIREKKRRTGRWERKKGC